MKYFLGIDYLRDEKEAGGTLNTLYLAKRVSFLRHVTSSNRHSTGQLEPERLKLWLQKQGKENTLK